MLGSESRFLGLLRTQLPCAGKLLMQASMMMMGSAAELLCRPTTKCMTSQCTASATAVQTCNIHLLLQTLAADSTEAVTVIKVVQQGCLVQKAKVGHAEHTV